MFPSVGGAGERLSGGAADTSIGADPGAELEGAHPLLERVVEDEPARDDTRDAGAAQILAQEGDLAAVVPASQVPSGERAGRAGARLRPGATGSVHGDVPAGDANPAHGFHLGSCAQRKW